MLTKLAALELTIILNRILKIRFNKKYYSQNNLIIVKSKLKIIIHACRAGSDGSMSASGSAGPGFDPRRGSKFSFENIQPSRLGEVEMYTF